MTTAPPPASSTPVPWPVVIEARHVRLSAAHVEMLFGPGHALLELVPLEHTGRFAAADVVDVRGPSGTLRGVRVVGPLVAATRVYVSDDDMADTGIEGRAAGISIEGPRGTLVLAAGAVDDVRRLVLPAREAAARALQPGASVDVIVHAERARELRGVPLEIIDGEGSAWLAIDVGNANAMDVGPLTRATLSSRG